ncbi:MAG: MmcQ/YjbR family DNA-binding protein [Actinomycetota bacterium]
MSQHLLDRVRQLALALPDVTERVSHHAPCSYVRKKPIGRFHDADFAGDGRVALWCPAPSGVREELVAADPERFFAPTPSASGVFGDWIGVYLDTEGALAVDWQEIAAILEDAFRLQAPKTLVAKLDQ